MLHSIPARIKVTVSHQLFHVLPHTRVQLRDPPFWLLTKCILLTKSITSQSTHRFMTGFNTWRRFENWHWLYDEILWMWPFPWLEISQCRMCLYASDVYGYHKIAKAILIFSFTPRGGEYHKYFKLQGNNYSKMLGHWKWDITHQNILDWKKNPKSAFKESLGCWLQEIDLPRHWVNWKEPIAKMPKRQNANSKQFDQKTEAFVALAGKSAGFPLRTISFSRFDAFVMNGQSLLCIHICISSIIIWDCFWYSSFWSPWLHWIGLSPGCMLSFHASAFCTGLLSSFVCLYLYLYFYLYLSLYFHLRLFLYLC